MTKITADLPRLTTLDIITTDISDGVDKDNLLGALTFDQLIELTGLFAIYPKNTYAHFRINSEINFRIEHILSRHTEPEGYLEVYISSPDIDVLNINVSLKEKEIEIFHFDTKNKDSDAKFRRFNKLIKAASHFGFKYITGTAFYDPPFNMEYFEYAKWGFEPLVFVSRIIPFYNDGSLIQKEIIDLNEMAYEQNKLAFQNLHDFLLTKDGCEKWCQNGCEWFGRFDLHPRSFSSYRFTNYLMAKYDEDKNYDLNTPRP